MSERYVLEDAPPTDRYVFEDAPPAEPPKGVGQIITDNLKATPGRMVSSAVDTVKGVVNTLAPPDDRSPAVDWGQKKGSFPTGKLNMAAGLGLTAGGPGSSVVQRLTGIAAGNVLDKPSADWWENVKTGGRSIAGDFDWRHPMNTILSPVTMETLAAASPLGGKIFRSTGYGARKVAEADAARVGGAMDEVAPTLKAGSTAPEMQRTAEGQGLTRIGAGKEAVVSDIEGRLAQAPAEASQFTGANGVPMVRTADGGRVSWRAARQPGEIYVPSLGKSMSLRDANEELSSIGDMMRGIKPLDPRYKDINLKDAYGNLANEIRDGIGGVLGPEAAAQWAKGQGEYRAGRFVGDELLGRQGVFQQGQFNIADLQRWLRVPDNRADLARALGGNLGTGENLGAYNRLVSAITRGAEPGMVDAARGLGFLDPRGSWGALAPVIRGVAKVLPNAPMRYVGRVPYAPARPAGDIQTLLDLAAQGGER